MCGASSVYDTGAPIGVPQLRVPLPSQREARTSLGLISMVFGSAGAANAWRQSDAAPGGAGADATPVIAEPVSDTPEAVGAALSTRVRCRGESGHRSSAAWCQLLTQSGHSVS